MSEKRFRVLGAALRNAVAWAVAWGVAGGAVFAAIGLFDPGPGVDSLVERLGLATFMGIAWGVRFGLAGAVVGTVFSIVIRVGYRGRRLSEINPLRFGLLGTIVGGVGVPLYLQAMNVLLGDGPIAWRLVTDDAPWAAVFAGAAAAGSILLARRVATSTHGPGPDQVERADEFQSLPAAGSAETSFPGGPGSIGSFARERLGRRSKTANA